MRILIKKWGRIISSPFLFKSYFTYPIRPGSHNESAGI